MKRNLFLKGLLFLSIMLTNIHSISQSITIDGPANSSPSTQETYIATFDYTPNAYTTLNWNVTGGTIVYQITNPTAQSIYCVVEWGVTNAGSISLYDDLESVTGDKTVTICGEADCSPNVTICEGQCTLIGVTAQPNCIYLWSPTAGLNDPTIAQPTACPTTTTTYIVTMTPQNGCPATQCPVTVTVNQKPSISPSGPIVKCVHYETQNWLTLTTNLTGNIEWYENGNLIPGQTTSTLILSNNPNNGVGYPNCTSTITVKSTSTGCTSEPVNVTRKNFFSPQVYLPRANGIYDTPDSYCRSQGGNIIQAPSFNSGTIYWWEVKDANGNPTSDITISPMYTTNNNATILISPNYSYSTATIVAKAQDNGCVGASDGTWNQQYVITLDPCRIGKENGLINEVTIKSNSSNFNISQFPNPSKDNFTIKAEFPILKIEILEASGKILDRFYPQNQLIYLVSTKYLANGLYFCNVTTTEGSKKLKFIVQK